MMSDTRVHFDLADTSDLRFDAPVEAMLIGLLAFAPAALGATNAWSESIVVVVSLLMLMTLALKLLCRPDVPFVRSWSYLPITLFIAFVLLQLALLPAPVVRVISPETFNLKDRLLSDLPESSQRLRLMTLSFYPEATRHDLRMLLALASVFVVVVNCIRRMSQVRRLLRAIVIIAAVLAIIALVQDAFGTQRIYGLFDTPDDTPARAGPFVNRAHFGQFMNLSIGAALGLALMQIHQHFRRENRYSTLEVVQKLRSRELKPAWMQLLAVVLMAAAIVLSLSRGAILSLAIAGAIAGLLVGTRKGMHGRGWIIMPALICVGVIALLNWPAFARQFDVSVAQARRDRWQMLRDLAREWKDFPIFGAGLGTHAVVFPMFDRSDIARISNHGENQYAQLLAEIGVIGGAIAGAFLMIVIAATTRAIRGAISIASSAALGLTYGLLAILANSFVSSGQHISSIALLTAVIFALLINLAELRWRELDRVSSALPARGSWQWRTAAMVAILAIASWLAVESYTSVRAELAWNDSQHATLDSVARQSKMSEAQRWRPDDINYLFALSLDQWKSAGANVGRFPEIVESVQNSQWICPTHGPSYLLAYEMKSQVPALAQQASRDVHLAFELSGPSAAAALELGKSEIARGETDLAVSHLQRAVQIDPSLSTEVMKLYISKMNRPDLALELAGTDLPALDALIKILDDLPNQKEFTQQVRQREFDVLIERADRADAPAAIIARAGDALARRNLHERAVGYFRRALAIEYGQVDWRMDLARSLEALGRNDEALHEAQLCLRSRAQMPQALELIDRLKQRTKPTRG